MKQDYPILEFDPDRNAIIEPSQLKPLPDMPERGVVCFFNDVIASLRDKGLLRHITDMRSEMGAHPVYEFKPHAAPIALFHPGVGASLAAALLEEIIALGCRKFIVCGAAGVLDKEIAVGYLLVPTSAVRDEGTSYHYLPPSREVAATPEAVAAVERTLVAANIPYLLTKTWTTDAFYRETRGKIRLRQSDGCLAVEMEAAALFAVARFRQVPIACMLYGGDDVSGESWDRRNWYDRSSLREVMVYLAAQACESL